MARDVSRNSFVWLRQAPQPDVQPPDPDPAHLQHISDMGFSDALARKALILSRNRVAEAIEWLLMHSEDADVDAPVTQEQLRRVSEREHVNSKCLSSDVLYSDAKGDFSSHF